MPRRKKPRADMTTKEAIRALFPKKVVDAVDRKLAEQEEKDSKATENTEESRDDSAIEEEDT